eukprot:XP_001694308.1 predicted protein [Chlamydomonas reinhardtii]
MAKPALTVRDYMEEVLRELPGAGEAVRSKNQMRASIKSLFPERDCHALVRPMLDESRLARMDALPPSELRPEFRKVGAPGRAACAAACSPDRRWRGWRRRTSR